MKKIVIASDSFKGSLTSALVAESVERGVRAVFPECDVRRMYVADGGEGTVEALVDSTGGDRVRCTVSDPLRRPVEAIYGVFGDGKAVMEMAAASGLALLTPAERNPMKTSTRGTGEMIRHALDRGCRTLLVGIGGSATNDAGTGMLQALGFRFFDDAGCELGSGGEILGRIAAIDAAGVPAEIFEASYTVACDVTAPFSGPAGAAHVFASQKGASPEMVAKLDAGLAHFAEVIKKFNGADIRDLPGAGAAGGLGGGFSALLGAWLVSGIEMVLDAIGFRAAIADADLIITGEGKLDAQTAMGKAPRGVLDAAREAGVPVVAIGGAVEGADELNRQGFAAVFPIVPGPVTLEQAMESEQARANVERTVEQIMRTTQTKPKQ
ncbi:MAG: glycerate kinase [Alistipes sp.]|jgi:glycerate kinase|nr:glycerate kinase [Alistipes sp.]